MVFWKWRPEDLDAAVVLPQVDELCDRSVFSTVAIGLEHANVSYDSDVAHATLAAVADRLRERGRHLVLSIDPRQEPRTGTRPAGDGLAWVDSLDVAADAAHVWQSTLGHIGDHFGSHPPVASEVLAVWRYRPGHALRGASSVTRVDDEVTAELGVGSATVRLPAAPGFRHLVLLCHWLDYPDVFARSTFMRHRELLERYGDLPIAGAAIDEWGPPSQPGREFSRAWSHPWWSSGLDAAYESETGRPLLEDLFRQRLGGDADGSQTSAIVDYFRVLRDRTAEFEGFHFDETRRVFGEDAYVGFHPTWWGVDEDRQSRELFKNGFNWWLARRDVAQTDEVVPMGVRLALARKAGRGPFFNMWYAMGTGDVRTHFRDAWYNARYGGRTNHHSFRCARETLVLALADSQALEDISAMEERIARMAEHFGPLVDAPVLVVAGWEAAVDWRRHVDETGAWQFSTDTLSRAYRVLRSLWNAGYVAELVPDYETLGTDGERTTWCGHAYDAALFVDATPAHPCGRARQVGTSADALEALAEWGVSLNAIPDGCRLEDGTILIAPAGGAGHVPAVVVDAETNARSIPPYDVANLGNRFTMTLTVDGHTIDIEADDFAVVKPHSLDVVAGTLHRLVVDGVARPTE